jgi:hypothetical protein
MGIRSLILLTLALTLSACLPEGNGEGYSGRKPVKTYVLRDPFYRCTRPGTGESIPSFRKTIQVYEDGEQTIEGDSCTGSPEPLESPIVTTEDRSTAFGQGFLFEEKRAEVAPDDATVPYYIGLCRHVPAPATPPINFALLSVGTAPTYRYLMRPFYKLEGAISFIETLAVVTKVVGNTRYVSDGPAPMRFLATIRFQEEVVENGVVQGNPGHVTYSKDSISFDADTICHPILVQPGGV